MQHFAQFVTVGFIESDIHFKGQQSLDILCNMMSQCNQRMYNSIIEALETNKKAVLIQLEIIFGSKCHKRYQLLKEKERQEQLCVHFEK